MRTSNDSENAGQPRFPRQRDDLHVEELDGEAVLYDPRNGAVHRFNAMTLMIWNGCNGSQMPKDIAAALVGPHSIPVDEALELVDSVIAELEARDLLHQHCAVADPRLLSSVGVHTEPPRQRMSTKSFACNVQQADATETAGRGISRRELLSGVVTKGVLAAPVISTFFAAGAYASGPSASAAFGEGGCKLWGYSCAVDADCCQAVPPFDTDQFCEGGKCCIEDGEDGCVDDADCCAGFTCISGTCD